ncbi:Bis(5'-nucleosyl)-tetraphosphatase symmetrical [termite gut metagenome]|uniref:Bis(5'-nucleosyl)-tetraphosphatase symmetrical n=2 Tax=termite gut metagenome TaxID=433724 RepID=A0A5J4RQ82_9ZZZZ
MWDNNPTSPLYFLHSIMLKSLIMKKIILFILLTGYSCIYAQNKTGLTTDGPYLLYEETGVRSIQVDSTGYLLDTVYKVLPVDFSLKVTSETGHHTFQVKLRQAQRPSWKDKQPAKVFVISDPHGDMDCFVSILRGGQIIDDTYKWTFGNNHLVVIGDVFDRGKDVLPVFWLLYKLQQEAEEAGGKATFLLGNHEEMVIRNNLTYTQKKYKQLADTLHLPYHALWQENSVLGQWLQTRNTMQVIGANLFVHAGLSPQLVSKHLSAPAVNDTISSYLFKTKEERSVSPLAAFLFGDMGPLWYRGMVRTDIKYNPANIPEVDDVLKEYHVNRVYVGHTIFTDIMSFFNEKIIGVNVDNNENYKGQRARGVLIEGKKVYLVYDSGTILERFRGK